MGMIVIGVDAHKRNHFAAAVDRQTAELRGQLEVDAVTAGHQALLAWGQQLHGERVWAIEDVRNMSRGLERVLIAAGETVLRVPPKLTAAERKAARSFGKSDPIDVLAIARAAIREPALPRAALDGIEREIAVLVDHRDDLVADATAHQRRLRWHLHELDPELKIPAAGLSNASNIDKVARRLQRLEQTVLVRVCRDLLRRIRELSRAAAELKRELASLVSQTAPQLLKIPGCGVLCAAAIIANVGPIARFANDSQLAAYAGVAPLIAASGRTTRHRLNRTGNRRLNRALHIIAVTQSAPVRPPRPTTPAARPKARATAKPAAPSSATSPAPSSTPSARRCLTHRSDRCAHVDACMLSGCDPSIVPKRWRAVPTPQASRGRTSPALR